MTAPEVEFEPVLADDVDWIATFVHANAWPFHSLHRPDEGQAREIAERSTADDHLGWFAVVAGERLGFITVADVDATDFDPSFDIRLAETARGKGVGGPLVRHATDETFTQRPGNVIRVEAFTRVDNRPMRRVLERSGYALEGYVRQNWPDNADPTRDRARCRLLDCVAYGITRADWVAGVVTPVPWDELRATP
jgi:RimJ/RimL family protein N-acetyltransferase